jgi:hypothetical protein
MWAGSIWIRDPRRFKPENLRTVLRQPVKKPVMKG